MQGRPRIDLPAIPQHIVQRGNDRQPCFLQDTDRIRTLQDLREVALAEHCGIHAYVLMTSHNRLLVTPTVPGQVSRLMQSRGRRYVPATSTRASTAAAPCGKTDTWSVQPGSEDRAPCRMDWEMDKKR